MFNKIKKACDEKNISLYKLSKDTGISQQVLQLLKARGGNLSTENLYKVAKYFDKPMEYFVEED